MVQKLQEINEMKYRFNEFNFLTASRYSIIENGFLWVISLQSNFLLKIDLDKKILVDVYPIPEKTSREYTHKGMIKIDDNIYIFPYYGKNIYVFNVNLCEFSEIDIPLNSNNTKGYYKFSNITLYNDKIFFLSDNNYGIFNLDIITKKIEINKEFVDDVEINDIDSETDLLYSEYGLRDDNRLLVPLYNQNKLLVFELNNMSYEIVVLSDNVKLNTINKFEDTYVFTTTDDCRIVCREKTIIKSEKLNILTGGDYSYFCVKRVNKKNYFFANTESKIIVEKNGVIKEIEFEHIGRNDYPEFFALQFMMVELIDNSIYFQLLANGEIYHLDTLTEKVNKVEIQIPENIRRKIIRNILDNNIEQIIYETDFVNIKNSLLLLN